MQRDKTYGCTLTTGMRKLVQLMPRLTTNPEANLQSVDTCLRKTYFMQNIAQIGPLSFQAAI